jgi:hypothetical protein
LSWDLDAQFNLFVTVIQFGVSRRNNIYNGGSNCAEDSRSCVSAAQYSLAARARVEPRYDTFFVSRSHAALAFFFDNASAISFYRPHRVVFAVWNSLRILFRARLWMKTYRYFQFQSTFCTWESTWFRFFDKQKQAENIWPIRNTITI